VRLADDAYLPGVLAAIIVSLVIVTGYILFTARGGTPLGIYDSGIGDHWPTGHQNLTVVDNTGSADWHQAIVAAAATWGSAGSALHFTVQTASGDCAPQRDQIEVCLASAAQIAGRGTKGEQGLFLPTVGRDHDYHSVAVLVCADCGVDDSRMTVIATHEIGHALGLAHNPDPLSVMYYQGGSSQPDSLDLARLHQLEGTG